jgi:universal stress protein E
MAKSPVILIALDRPDAPGVLWQRAAALARRFKAELHVEAFLYGGSLARTATLESPDLQARMRKELEAHRASLSAAARALRDAGLVVKVRVAWGAPPADAINARAKTLKPLVVLRAVGEDPGLARVVRTPLDWQLLRECPAPVLLVSPSASTSPQRIIAAIDPGNLGGKPSELNLRILRTAKRWATTFKAKLHVLHAFEAQPVPVTGFGDAVLLPAVADASRKARLEAFKALCDAQKIPVLRQHFIDGTPAEVIAQFTQNLATDLVVLGSMERSFVGRALLGSTAERVLYHLHSDVLALKPRPFRAHKWLEPVVSVEG